jgi:hypothetical protein
MINIDRLTHPAEAKLAEEIEDLTLTSQIQEKHNAATDEACVLPDAAVAVRSRRRSG